MDPATIVSTVMAVITPFVKKGVTAFAKAAGQAACDKAQQLLDFVKGKLAGDQTASDNLKSFEEDPEAFQPAIQSMLQKKLSADPALAASLETRLKEMGPQLVVIQEIEKADRAVAVDAGEINSGNVTATQKIKEARDATAVRVNRIG